MIMTKKIYFFHNWVEFLSRWCLGIIFLYSSYHKIIDPAQLAKIIYGYGLFPHYLINLIAIILPFMELISGLALVLGIYPKSAAIIINAMLLIFIISIAINLIRGHQFNCGCFSFGHQGDIKSVQLLLVRDIICFSGGVQVIMYQKTRKFCLLSNG